MKPKIIFIILAIFVLIIILGVVLERVGKPFFKSTGLIPGFSPSPTTNLLPSGKQVAVVSTDPKEGDKNVSLNKRVFISFDNIIPLTGISIQITPSVNYSYQVLGQDLLIIPTSGFAKKTEYRLRFLVSGLQTPNTLTFTTGMENSSGSIDVTPQLYQGQQNSLLQNSPDSYLASSLPYSVDSFAAAIGTLKNNFIPSYSFVITLKSADQDIAKNNFLSWAKSLGLNDQQIATLGIAYITPDQANLVTALKSKPPYNGNGFTMDYTKATDTTEVIIYKESQQAGEQEFNNYLQQRGIDKSWINNLDIEYQ